MIAIIVIIIYRVPSGFGNLKNIPHNCRNKKHTCPKNIKNTKRTFQNIQNIPSKKHIPKKIQKHSIQNTCKTYLLKYIQKHTFKIHTEKYLPKYIHSKKHTKTYHPKYMQKHTF